MFRISRGRVATKVVSCLALFLLLSPPSARTESTETEAVVLCYHVVQSPTDSVYSIDRETFREQMRYLAATEYNVIPLADLLDYIEGKRDSLPPNPVVITVDDGWRCTYTEIYPELQRLNFPFTVFIYPKFIQRTRNPYALTWQEVKSMADAGVDIQSHTFSHPYLTHRMQSELPLGEYLAWLHDELSRSKKVIEKETGRPVRFLAYPYGDYDTKVAKAAKKSGYDAALTSDYGPVRKGSDPFRMRRVSLYKETTFREFREFLGAGPLRLDTITPAPGEAFDPKNPVIEARIEHFEKLDPESVRMSLLSLGQTPYSYNPENGAISLVVREPLAGSEQRVVIWANDKQTGRRVEATWRFYVNGREDEPAAGPAATRAGGQRR